MAVQTEWREVDEKMEIEMTGNRRIRAWTLRGYSAGGGKAAPELAGAAAATGQRTGPDQWVGGGGQRR
jgi:hypothetical protein